MSLQILSLVDMAAIIKTVEPTLASSTIEYLPFSFMVAVVGPLSLMSAIVSTWSVALLKTSIAVMLLRFQQARAWAIFLYVVVGVQIATAVFVTIMQSTRCVPIQALWDPTLPQDRCWSQNSFKIGLTIAAVLVIVTDFIFALIPLVFLRNIRRSLRDRLIIGFLMSLGLFASAASIVKAVSVQGFDQSADSSGTGLVIAIWASVESQVGIIAACIPCLRAPFLRLLGLLGISSDLSGVTGGNKSAWQAQSQPLGGGTSRSVRIHSTAQHGGFVGKDTINDSEEDILARDDGGRSRRHRIEVKTDIDIEMASVTATTP